MHGLASVLPIAKAKATILRVDGHRFSDVDGKQLDDSEIEDFKQGRDIYLLAPPEKVMSKKISDSQKGLPLATVAEEVLPFEAHELFIASDRRQENIHTIVRSALSVQRQEVEANGIPLAGIAFDDGGAFVFAAQGGESPTENQKAAKFFVLSLLILLPLLVATFGLLSHFEGRRQASLIDELTRLEAQLEAGPILSVNALAKQANMRGATDILSLLTPLADALTEKVVLDQLIISDNELLIDASAQSATQVLANIDASGVFESSEFVTSISRSTTSKLERFRLKASLKAGQ